MRDGMSHAINFAEVGFCLVKHGFSAVVDLLMNEPVARPLRRRESKYIGAALLSPHWGPYDQAWSVLTGRVT